MMMTVARLAGWSEEEILWRIPLKRLVLYVHAGWSYDALKCRWSCYVGGDDSGGVGNALEEARRVWDEQLEQLE